MKMKPEYESSRLLMAVSRPEFAAGVADYLLRNREEFEYYDRHYGDITYTSLYQENALKAEQELYETKAGIRYYLFKKEDPETVIGNISFAYLHSEERAPSLGYKIDKCCRRMGYAYEAASFLLPENEASIALLKKLGFRYDGISTTVHEIQGVPRDHYRFVFDPTV